MKRVLHHRASSSSNESLASRQITQMLLVVSTTFLVLNLPSHAFRVHHFVVGLLHKQFSPSQTYADCQMIFQYVYYLNFATNFFLYSLCGRNFRRALTARCCGKAPCMRGINQWSMRRRESGRSAHTSTVSKFSSFRLNTAGRDVLAMERLQQNAHLTSNN
jgi:hypothetical protein